MYQDSPIENIIIHNSWKVDAIHTPTERQRDKPAVVHEHQE